MPTRWATPAIDSSTVPPTTKSTDSASGSSSGRCDPPPAATSAMYHEKVSAKPDSGRAITHSRVSSQCGSRLVTMSRMVPRGSTAYASVKTARSVVSSVCAGRPPFGT